MSVVLLIASVGIGFALLGPGAEHTSSPTASATPTASPVPTASSTPTPEPLLPGNNWTQYRFDITGTGMNPEDTISWSNTALLSKRWMLEGYSAFESTPAIVDGIIYVTNGNSLYAFDLRTGAKLWQHQGIDQQISTINSSAAVDPITHLAYYGTPDARVYAVDTRTGSRVWMTQLDTSTGAFVWSSPLLLNGRVYVGLASHDDHPCVRGAVFALDAASGKTIWVHHTVPQGALGGTVWSSLSADPDSHEVIATTGNPCPGGPTYAEQDAILGLNWDTGAANWRYSALAYDACDCDFGEGPAIFTYQNRRYIIAGNKHGDIFALVRTPSGGGVQLAWSLRITHAGFVNEGGIFEPPTYGNGLVYIAGGPSLDGVCTQGGLYALHVDTGMIAWRACTAGQVIGPSALVGEVLWVPQQGEIVLYGASSGNVLSRLPQNGATWGGVAISHGYVVSGTVSGNLYCYSLTSLSSIPPFFNLPW